MPGHNINARCICGFGRSLSPGLNDIGPLVELGMAYTEGEVDFGTFELKEIARRKLKPLDDPFLEREDLSVEENDQFLEAQK
jgi:hypothetical protein